jgi:hypothetical protein
VYIIDIKYQRYLIVDKTHAHGSTAGATIKGGNNMINFIKCNRVQLLTIAACVVALVAMNAHVLNVTHGCYNLITILF